MAKKTQPQKASKIRVYRLAEQIGVTGKELLEHLQGIGYDFKSVQNTIELDAAEEIAKGWGKGKKAKAKKATSGAKKAKSKSKAKEKDEEEAPKKGRSSKASKAAKAAKAAKAEKTTKSSKSKAKAKSEEETLAKEEPKAKPTKKGRKTTKKGTKKAKAVEAEVVETEVEVAEEVVEAVELPERMPAAAESDLNQEAYLRGFAQQLLKQFFIPSASVEEGNSSATTQEFVVRSEEAIDIPSKREVLGSIAYLLNKVDSYHFDGGRRFFLQLQGPDSPPVSKETDTKQREKASSEHADEQPLAGLALLLAELAQNLGKSVVIDQLSSQERRGIHTALAEQNDFQVNTFSDGEGIFRRLVISPNS